VSRYEALRNELGPLKARQAGALAAPTIFTAVLLAMAAGLLAGVAALAVLPFALHRLWRLTLPAYRAWSDRAAQISAEIAELRQRITAIFEKYRERHKGERFKQAYELNGRAIQDLEEALSVGMYRERREVFVTAFMRRGVAVRVTASIGSPFRCSASDDPARWAGHLERLGCDELRQYHNHPVHDGLTHPSRVDVRTSRSIKTILGPHGAKLRSLIICWNGVREWKVFEYDDAGRHWLHSEFDAAVVE
jgi:hypothetical protein